MNSQSSDHHSSDQSPRSEHGSNSEQFMLRIEVVDAYVYRVWLGAGDVVMAELSCPRCESGLGVVDCSKARYIKCNVCNQLCRISV